jgi:hypothetical protein
LSNSGLNLRLDFGGMIGTIPELARFSRSQLASNAVGEEHFVRNTLDQLRSFTQIMALLRHQAKADKVAKRVCQGQNFGGNSTARTPYTWL